MIIKYVLQGGCVGRIKWSLSGIAVAKYLKIHIVKDLNSYIELTHKEFELKLKIS